MLSTQVVSAFLDPEFPSDIIEGRSVQIKRNSSLGEYTSWGIEMLRLKGPNYLSEQTTEEVITIPSNELKLGENFIHLTATKSNGEICRECFPRQIIVTP